MARHRGRSAVEAVEAVMVVTGAVQTIQTQVLRVRHVVVRQVRAFAHHDVRHEAPRLGSNLGRNLLGCLRQQQGAGSLGEQSLREYLGHVLARADRPRPLQLLGSGEAAGYCQVVEITSENRTTFIES